MSKRNLALTGLAAAALACTTAGEPGTAGRIAMLAIAGGLIGVGRLRATDGAR